MKNEKIINALKELAAEHKAHIEYLKNIQEISKVILCYQDYIHIFEGLSESGLEMKRVARGGNTWPTQYEAEIDGVRFIQLSSEPFEKE